MNMCCGKLRVLALLCGLFLQGSLAGLFMGTVHAQDVIGVLPEVLKPEVAAKLKLSDEQKAQFSELIKRRSSEMIGLAQQLREAPPNQKDQMRTEFRQESERQGYAILDLQQRSQLEQIRVERLGLLALAEPAIAKVVNLADWQQAKVSELVGQAYAAARGPDADRVRGEVERALRREISDSQFAAWEVLAGKSPGAEIGDPQPPERKTPEAAVTQTADTSSPSDARPTGNTPDRTPIGDVQLRMNFQAMPWADVLKWLCEQADMSLQADAMPPGSFTYRDNSRKYSVGEAMDIMSASLLNKGYALLRRDRLLMVVDLEAPLVENMIKELAEFVPLEKLDSRGDFELVKCLFFLSRMNPDDAKKEVEQLLSLQGSVVSLPSAGQIQVTDTAGVVRAVRALIERAEDPETIRGSSIVAIPLKHITASEVLDVARPLLNLPEGANSNQDISLSTDTFGNMLFVNAKKPEDTQKLRDLIQHLDVAPSESEQVSGKSELPVVLIHEIQGSDPDLAFRVLSQRLASEPEVRMELDKETNKLVVQARPTTHEEIDEVLRMLSGQSSQFEVIELKNLDTQLAIATIKKFFGLSDTGAAEAGAPIIDGDLIMRRLYVKASPEQLEQIRTLIEKLEGSTTSSNFGENVRVIPMAPRKLDSTIQQIERLWEATRKRNRLRVVVPGESMAESALRQKAIVVEDRGESEVNGANGHSNGHGNGKPEASNRTSNNKTTATEASRPQAARTQAARTQAAQTQAARTQAARTQAARPQTLNGDVQEVVVPEADVPEADVPEADVPEADVPEADVPEAGPSDAPLTDDAPQLAPEADEQPQTRLARPLGRFVSAPQDAETKPSADDAAGEGTDAENSLGEEDDSRELERPASTAAASDAASAEADDIVIMPGPGGLIVTSSDGQALAEFDNMLRMLVDQSATSSTEPTFYWLKYIRAAAAKELLEAVLSGSTTSSSSGGGGGLIGDMVSEVGGGLIGSLLGGGGGGVGVGATSLTTGDVIINADPRLNALIIRANAIDLELCEQLLKVFDQPDSPISVQTRGMIEVIPVLSQDAEAVASIVKGLFNDRIEGGGSGGGGGGGRPPDPREIIAALAGGRGGGRGGSANSQLTETKISITVDKNTNSLVVMAQPQDVALIRTLVDELDVAGGDVEERIEVVSLTGTNLNAGMIDSALKGVLGSKAKTSTTASGSSSGGSGGSNQSGQSQQGGGGDDADQARRRAEFFQQLRDRIQSGGGGGDRGGSGGGGGGFRGFGGGGGGGGFGGGGFPGFNRGGGGGSNQGGRGGR